MPTQSSPPEPRAWVLAGPADALARLSPLIAARRAQRPVRIIGDTTPVDTHLDDAAAALVVGRGKRSARSAMPGVFLTAPNGRRVPAGFLPDAGDRLEHYALAAAEVQRRVTGHTAATGPIALLNELDPRAIVAASRIAAAIGDGADVLRWGAERLSRRDLLSALGCGPAAAIYVGHALAGGWVGYGGVQGDAAAPGGGRPIGAVLSLSCSVASRPRGGFSFAEELVLGGACAAALGAVRRTLHRRNVALGLALGRALRNGSVATLGDWLLAVPGQLAGYRILGDPLAPLVGDAAASARARAVFAPAPDDVLPVLPLSAWA